MKEVTEHRESKAQRQGAGGRQSVSGQQGADGQQDIRQQGQGEVGQQGPGQQGADGQQNPRQQKEYEKYVKEVTPTHNLFSQMLKAFVTGGIICCIGQFILNYGGNMGLDKQTAGSWCSLILVLLSAVLTGFGIYPKIVKWGGAGALVPITGFANSVAAPAIEYKAEGQVFGIGAKIFSIAGPVILYGLVSSWVLGLVYWILKMTGVA